MRFSLFIAVFLVISSLAFAIPAGASCWQNLGSQAARPGLSMDIAPDGSVYVISTTSSQLSKYNSTWQSFAVLATHETLGVSNSTSLFVAGKQSTPTGLSPAVARVDDFARSSEVDFVVEDFDMLNFSKFTFFVKAGDNMFLTADPGLVSIFQIERNTFVGQQLFAGENVSAATADGSNLLVGTTSGTLIKITPDTLSKTPLNSPTARKITAVIRTSNNGLYIADEFNSIFYSANNGQGWTTFVSAGPFSFVDFAERSGIVYAVNGNVNRIHASLLGNNSWQSRDFPTGSLGIKKAKVYGGLVYAVLADNSLVYTFACVNTPPTARAEGQTVEVNSSFAFDASNSTDPEGDALSYNWEFRGPPEALAGLQGLTSTQLTGRATVVGSYEFALTVTDNGFPNMTSAVTLVKLSVLPAGGEQNVTPPTPAPVPSPSPSPTPQPTCTANTDCRADEACVDGDCKQLTCPPDQAIANHSCFSIPKQPTPVAPQSDWMLLAIIVIAAIVVIAYLFSRRKIKQ